MNLDKLFETIDPVVLEARQAILDVYHSGDFETEEKTDKSPITRADRASHKILSEGLSGLFPEIPVISEESRSKDYAGGRGLFWLVDPLDGTKEFVRRTGEFTINVGLVDAEGRPVWGVVDVPLSERSYYGGDGAAFCRSSAGVQRLARLTEAGAGQALRVAVSRSHRGAADDWLRERNIAVKDLVYAGSAVKFCWIAEGSVDLYVRLLPTMGWDTAAGQAVVEAVGGGVTTLDGKSLTYRPHAETNPEFLASRPIR